MLLHEIRNRILLAQKNLEEINPTIKCYLVVSINCSQFMPGDLMSGNLNLVDLMKRLGIFLPGQDLEKLVKFADQINQIKNAKTCKPENGKLILDLFAQFSSLIEKVKFHEAQVELRFYTLDMEKIQELKAHPIVQKTGKTDMSTSSINVVIG